MSAIQDACYSLADELRAVPDGVTLARIERARAALGLQPEGRMPAVVYHLNIGDTVEYRRPGVTTYVCEVINIDVSMRLPFLLRVLSVPSNKIGSVYGREFRSGHKNILRVLSFAPAPDPAELNALFDGDVTPFPVHEIE